MLFLYFITGQSSLSAERAAKQTSAAFSHWTLHLICLQLHCTMEGVWNPPPQDRTWPPCKARADWFPAWLCIFFAFLGNSYLASVLNAVSLKCFDCKVLIPLPLPHFSLSWSTAWVDRCGKENNETQVNDFQVQTSKSPSTVAVLFSDILLLPGVSTP